jgi:hypothetical protein
MSQAIASASRDVTTWRDRFAARFFLAASIVMLAIVVLGFAPTLLLRPLFDVPSIPAYLFVHGAVLCMWFVWFFVQSALVAMRRTDLHRRSGIVGVAIAACVVGASLFAIVKWIPRMRELGTDFETEGARLASGIIGDSLMLVQFIPLVALAVLWRGRPAIHKRLMFLASLAILIPAGARTPTVFAALGLSPVAAPFVAYVLFTVAAPITYDLLTRKRPHVATIICVPANLGSVVVSIAIASNETARAFILGMF